MLPLCCAVTVVGGEQALVPLLLSSPSALAAPLGSILVPLFLRVPPPPLVPCGPQGLLSSHPLNGPCIITLGTYFSYSQGIKSTKS